MLTNIKPCVDEEEYIPVECLERRWLVKIFVKPGWK